MKHLLVHMDFDDHQGVYGVYSSVDAFLEDFDEETPFMKASLAVNYTMDEMKGKTVIDSVGVDEILASRGDELDDETKKIIANHLGENR